MKKEIQRDIMEYDVVIVGAGPAGLATAIKLKQINSNISVCILEKSSEIGGHILSGNIFESRALDELIYNWQEKNPPIKTKVTNEEFLWLKEKSSINIPTYLLPNVLKNHKNHIISLGSLCCWLGEIAEQLEVDIFPGFSASKVIYNEKGEIKGIQTGDMGLDKNYEQKNTFAAGIKLHSKVTVFSEGCRGHLGKQLIKKFNLDEEKSPQQYGIGFKEIWQIKPENHKLGLVTHTVGWPLDNKTYGGGFCYHAENNQVYLGYVVGLDYKNPHLSPYDEFQRFKTHIKIKNILSGGKRISYGAKALIEGGLQSLPKMYMPGGLLIGCDAGTLNMPKIKGSHTAMKSGILAAETINDYIAKNISLSSYENKFKNSWLYKELYKSRNVKPSFKWGLPLALIFTGIDQLIFHGKLPFTLKNKIRDCDKLLSAKKTTKINYPKYDNVYTFDKTSSVYLTNISYNENQPIHLQLKDPNLPITYTFKEYDEPATKYCPAGVYEIKEINNEKVFIINAQNCIHCKTCDIKEPSQNINWVTPEGGSGPNYINM